MTVEKLFFFPIPPGGRSRRERERERNEREAGGTGGRRREREREQCRTVEQDLAQKRIWFGLPSAAKQIVNLPQMLYGFESRNLQSNF